MSTIEAVFNKGDLIKVKPSKRGLRDGFSGVFRDWRVEGGREVATVWGGKSGHESWRTVALSRVVRAPKRRTHRG